MRVSTNERTETHSNQHRLNELEFEELIKYGEEASEDYFLYFSEIGNH